VSLAIDRQAMVRLVSAAGPRRCDACDAGVKLRRNKHGLQACPRVRPPRRGKRLEAAGFHGGAHGELRDHGAGGGVTLLVSSAKPERMQMAAMIQQEPERGGIEVRVAGWRSRTLQDRVLTSKNYEACLLALAFGDTDPGSEMNLWPSNGTTMCGRPGRRGRGSSGKRDRPSDAATDGDTRICRT